MGYEVYITRASDWVESNEQPIALEEWLSYIENTPDMKHDGYAEATSPNGDIIRYENVGLSVWTGYSKNGLDGGKAWFDYRDGNIIVKNPDSEILVKMYEIAQELEAMVQGDDGEVYDENGQSNWQGKNVSVETEKKPWWKFW